MMRSALRTMVLAAALLSVLPAQADFEAGQQAWDAGRTGEALAQWRTAAGKGDRRAMRALGQAYLQGIGLLQDYVEAHKWFNLAASRGDAAAVAERNAVAEKMTSEHVGQAQALARTWRPVEVRRPASGAPASPEASSPSAAGTEESLIPVRTPVSEEAGVAEKPPPSAVVEEESLTPRRTPVPDETGN